MICNQCGKQLSDGAKFCPVCGAQTNSQSATRQQAQGNGTSYANNQQQEDRKISSIEEVLVDKNEKQIAVLGSGYLSSFLHGGTLDKGFGILTDKRYYFKGKCYTKSGRGFAKTDEEWTVDVKDITATGFMFGRKISLLVLAIISVIAGIAPVFSGVFYGDEGVPFLIGGIVLGIIFLVAYILSKRSMYFVTFAGGSIALKTSKYGGVKEIRKFDKTLRQTKDRAVHVM